MARRHSAQKGIIGEVLARLDHPTAAEVYEEVRKNFPQISLGTVYRNLSLMAENGELLRLYFPEAPDRFDPNAYEHYHAVCLRCGRIFDTDRTVPGELIGKIDQAVEACTGVRVESRVMIFSGVCKACQSGGRTQENL
ncbi:MAG: transcriptional repressor [Synergistaceae bacterium]|jgi:Fur family peroxide stress response transcriptional regulator|nr:transcriptional repressor [Synergistaceae bacterium]